MKLWYWAAVVVAVPAGGCGSPPPPDIRVPIEVYPVGGRVTVGGAPAPGARVTFYPADPRPEPPFKFWAVTGADGRFACSTNTTGDGLPPGKYALSVTWPEELTDNPEGEADRLNRRYADPKRARLPSVEVRAPSVEVPPLDLR